jgi:hypothetical protein
MFGFLNFSLYNPKSYLLLPEKGKRKAKTKPKIKYKKGEKRKNRR